MYIYICILLLLLLLLLLLIVITIMLFTTISDNTHNIICICICVCMYVCMYIYIYIYIYITSSAVLPEPNKLMPQGIPDAAGAGGTWWPPAPAPGARPRVRKNGRAFRGLIRGVAAKARSFLSLLYLIELCSSFSVFGFRLNSYS